MVLNIVMRVDALMCDGVKRNRVKSLVEIEVFLMPCILLNSVRLLRNLLSVNCLSTSKLTIIPLQFARFFSLRICFINVVMSTFIPCLLLKTFQVERLQRKQLVSGLNLTWNFYTRDYSSAIGRKPIRKVGGFGFES